MSQYYLRGLDQQTYGPYTAAQLKQFVIEGRIAPDMTVSRDQQQWTRAADIPGLFPPAAAPAAPPPPPPVVVAAAGSSGSVAVLAPLAATAAPGYPSATPRPALAGFTPEQRRRRILLLVLFAAVLALFFAPFFYVSVSPRSAAAIASAFGASGTPRPKSAAKPPSEWGLDWAWECWWAWGCLAGAVGGLAGAIVDLSLQRTGARRILCWIHLAMSIFVLAIVTLGTLLALTLGIDPMESLVSAVASILRLPLAPVLILGAMVVALITAVQTCKDRAVPAPVARKGWGG